MQLLCNNANANIVPDAYTQLINKAISNLLLLLLHRMPNEQALSDILPQQKKIGRLLFGK